jgi:hypothetical protein
MTDGNRKRREPNHTHRKGDDETSSRQRAASTADVAAPLSDVSAGAHRYLPSCAVLCSLFGAEESFEVGLVLGHLAFHLTERAIDYLENLP